LKVQLDVLLSKGFSYKLSEHLKSKTHIYSSELLVIKNDESKFGHSLLATMKLPVLYKQFRCKDFIMCYILDELIFTQDGSDLSDTDLTKLVYGGCINFVNAVYSEGIYVGQCDGVFATICPTAGYYELAKSKGVQSIAKYWTLEEALSQGEFRPLTVVEILKGIYL
jgi:hypothetical protein